MAALRVVCLLLLLACVPGLAQADDCLSGTVSAVEITPGVWKYCLSLTYDVTALTQSPSHFSLILGALSECPCACSPGFFEFETPAGSSPGTDQGTDLPCTVDYNGVFGCDGDPTLPEFSGLALKWEVTPGTCEPNLTGTATLCFLSLLPPGDPSSTTAAIKVGQNSCSGTMTGTLPSCSCPTLARPGTWGRLKMLYR